MNSRQYFDINKGKIYDFLTEIGYEEDALYNLAINEFESLSDIKSFFKEQARKKGYKGRTNYKRMGNLFETPISVEYIRSIREARITFLRKILENQKRIEINRLLSNKKFQAILNMVKDGKGKITLNSKQVERFINFFKNSSEKYRLKLLIKGKEYNVHINDLSYSFVEYLLKNGFIARENGSITGSDYID